MRNRLSMLVAIGLVGSALLSLGATPVGAGEAYVGYKYISGSSTGPYSGTFYTAASDYLYQEMWIDNVAWGNDLYASGYSRSYTSGTVLQGHVTSTTHKDTFTCASPAISSVSIGTSGASVSGWFASKTLTMSGTSSTYKYYRYYQNSGRYNCRATLPPVKTTHESKGSFLVDGYSEYNSRAAAWSHWWAF